MKDYEALSRKHFDHQAAEYDARDTVYYSREGKISCRDIAAQLKAVPYEALLDVDIWFPARKKKERKEMKGTAQAA